MQATGRLYLCACCRMQVIVCPRCDRGQRYCRPCAPLVRRARQREAGRRYQQSRKGRFAHAARMRQHRARQKKVTHQGSPAPACDGVLAQDRITLAPPAMADVAAPLRCHHCGLTVAPFLRREPLRRRGAHHRWRSP